MKLLKRVLREDIATVLIAVLLIGLLLGSIAPGFASPYNLNSLARTIAVTTIVGFSQLCVLSIGHFNLALGAMGGSVGMLVGALLERYAVPVVPAIMVGLLVGMLAGAIQGYLIVKTGINPLVITLSLLSVYLGITTGVARGQIYSQLPQTFVNTGQGNVLGIPVLFMIALVSTPLLFVIMYRTPLGRQLLATGASQRAAFFSGIPTLRLVVVAHAMSGLLAGGAAIMQVAWLGTAQVSIGSDWMLVSFAAPVIGGTLLSGGKASVIGTILGATLMAIIRNGLVLLDISFYWFQTFLGIILLGAFSMDRMRLLLSRK